jgi:hypothetical protein
MSTLESAAKAFFLVTEVSRLIRLAHDRGCKWNYEILADMTKDELPQPTGGCEIRVIIHPPPSTCKAT